MLKRLQIYYVYAFFPYLLMLGGAVYFFHAIQSTIKSNPHPQINYTIFIVILLGGLLIMRGVHNLILEGKKLHAFSAAMRDKVAPEVIKEMALNMDADIAYVLRMMAASMGRPISHQEQIAIEHELDKAGVRLSGGIALPQFLTGLLVGLGLLGTFIGLLATLGDISALISSFASLDMGKANPVDVFRNMVSRMEAPMRSMAIAFSASMYGLLGSIILGFMMVGMRRCLAEIKSRLGSEVAQHVEFALSHEGFTYSKSALRQQADKQDRLGRSGLSPADPKNTALGGAGAAERPLAAENNPQSAGTAAAKTFAPPQSLLMPTVLPATPGQAVQTLVRPLPAGDAEGATRGGSDELRVLRRIEEKLGDSSRLQERTLQVELDQFNKGRTELLRVMSEHSEAVGQFRSELQRVGRQMGTILQIMERGNRDLLSQLNEHFSELITMTSRSGDMMGPIGDRLLIMAEEILESRNLSTEIVSHLRATAVQPQVGVSSAPENSSSS